MKKILVVVCMVFLGLTIACSDQNNEQKKNETDLSNPKIESMSIDSLSKLGIDITLWTEGKIEFETITKDTLKEVAWSVQTFSADMRGSEAFDWSVIKKYMRWHGNNKQLSIFNNKKGQKFVVIGAYFPSTDALTLRFMGNLYQY